MCLVSQISGSQLPVGALTIRGVVQQPAGPSPHDGRGYLALLRTAYSQHSRGEILCVRAVCLRVTF